MNDNASITEQDAVDWLERFKRASESRDADGLVVLFAQDIRYRDSVFGEVKQGRECLRRYWRDDVLLNQRDICFDFEVWGVRDCAFMAFINISYMCPPMNSIIQIDGVCTATLGARESENLVCTSFDKWFDQAEVT